jgi:hypothetical protein
MFSLLISAAVTITVIIACNATGIKTGTTVFFGITGFLASYYLTGWLVRKRVKAVQTELENVIQGGQLRIRRKIQQLQTKPGISVKLIQRQVESDQKVVFKEALAFTGRLEPFKKWNLLMGRQIDTMRLQFLYQLKEFEQVDELLALRGLFRGPMLTESITVAMKMARQYKNGDMEGAEKIFRRRIKWYRGDRGTLLYGLMAWIWVKQGAEDKARELLQKAKETTGDETLALNWERLCNNKAKNFSNEGLGEEWYSLHLENPPTPKQQRPRAKMPKGRRF